MDEIAYSMEAQIKQMEHNMMCFVIDETEKNLLFLKKIIEHAYTNKSDVLPPLNELIDKTQVLKQAITRL
ncbi:MAG: hypothetical protein KF900_14125 [Bacteroidetes bacterium]|nr:hypothetical protein [Bacteroidota bacterium]